MSTSSSKSYALRANLYCLLALLLAAAIAYFFRHVPLKIVLLWFGVLASSYLVFLAVWFSLWLGNLLPACSEFLVTTLLFFLVHFACELSYLFCLMARGGFFYHLAK